MNLSEDAIIDGILDAEGRVYTNRKADRGGPTKFGITQKALAEWKGHAVTPRDVELLTEAEARTIYRVKYITAPRFSLISDPGLRRLVIDCGVLYGQPTAALWLQEAINQTRSPFDQIAEDGVLGPASFAALAHAEAGGRLERVRLAVIASRIKKAGRIASKDPSQLENINGWLNRACAFLMET